MSPSNPSRCRPLRSTLPPHHPTRPAHTQGSTAQDVLEQATNFPPASAAESRRLSAAQRSRPVHLARQIEAEWRHLRRAGQRTAPRIACLRRPGLSAGRARAVTRARGPGRRASGGHARTGRAGRRVVRAAQVSLPSRSRSPCARPAFRRPRAAVPAERCRLSYRGLVVGASTRPCFTATVPTRSSRYLPSRQEPSLGSPQRAL